MSAASGSGCVSAAHLPSWHVPMFVTQSPRLFVVVVLSFMEPVYNDPADYFDITQHEVDRQDELEYEVGAH